MTKRTGSAIIVSRGPQCFEGEGTVFETSILPYAPKIEGLDCDTYLQGTVPTQAVAT